MDSVNSSDLNGNGISVADFYAGKSVFITGGTGFLGKVIIEKLLYSCPQIDKIYVLIREKNKLNINQRVQKMMDLLIFDRLRNENPHQLTKVVPIAGDVSLPGMGIKPEDETLLLNKINVVIHSAATTKFNERLNTAIQVNYEGTKHVLDMCKRMKNINVFVHISTAFSNTSEKEVEEAVYPLAIDINQLYEKLQDISEKDESKLFCGKPNTYTFSKSLAESFILESHGNIPAVIIKPSAVTASKSEPVEGWLDSKFGASMLLTGTSNGFCRTIISKKDYHIDIIPVDYVSNLIIVAAAKCHTSKDVQVFNSCTSSVNPISFGQICDTFNVLAVKNKFNVVPFPKVVMTQCRFLYWIVILFSEIIPAYVADFCLIQFGNPPKFINIQAKVSKFRSTSEYFLNKSWFMKNDKAQGLASSLSPKDAALFPCDPSDISWSTYLETYIGGINRFLLRKK